MALKHSTFVWGTHIGIVSIPSWPGHVSFDIKTTEIGKSLINFAFMATFIVYNSETGVESL